MTPPVQDNQRGTRNAQPGGRGEAEFAPPSSFAPLSTLNSQRPIELHIEELVLHGFAPGHLSRIREAVESELHRLLAEQGLPEWLPAEGHLERRDGGQFAIRTGAKSQHIGGQVAQAIYKGDPR